MWSRAFARRARSSDPQAAREADVSFQLFAESVHDVFWVVQLEPERTLYVSPSYERLTGFSSLDLRARPNALLDLVHPDDRVQVREYVDRIRSGCSDPQLELEVRIVRADQQVRWIRGRIVGLRGNDGRITRLSGIASDITAQKQAEANLRESEARFRNLWESSPAGLFRTDRRHRVIDFNARLLEICAVQAEHVRKRPLLELVHVDDRDVAAANWRRLARSEREMDWECRLEHPTGPARTVLMRVAPERNAEGKIVGYTGTISDITDYREVQTRLLLSERMASLGTLAAGVGHEINNPLTYLMCNLELALRNAHGQLEERPYDERCVRSVELLNIAFEGSRRIRDIVRELRVFSRAETDQLTSVDVLTCVEAALNIALNQVRHRARLVRNFKPVSAVHANEVRLGQVFLNLIVNAAQAMPEGCADDNTLTVSVYPELGRDLATIEVRDTGSGIAPELISRIFDPFFTTKAFGEGTGLGLFLAQQTVHSYGGSITVESEPGRGSVFRVHLPMLAGSETQPSEEEAPEDPRTTARARILVIDDEREVGMAVAAMLGEEHDVTATTQAQEALELIKQRDFDVILCDLMMPTMSASAFFAELKQVAPAAVERLSFMTGGAFTDSARSFLSESGRPLVNKPFGIAALNSVMAEMLAR